MYMSGDFWAGRHYTGPGPRFGGADKPQDSPRLSEDSPFVRRVLAGMMRSDTPAGPGAEPDQVVQTHRNTLRQAAQIDDNRSVPGKVVTWFDTAAASHQRAKSRTMKEIKKFFAPLMGFVMGLGALSGYGFYQAEQIKSTEASLRKNMTPANYDDTVRQLHALSDPVTWEFLGGSSGLLAMFLLVPGLTFVLAGADEARRLLKAAKTAGKMSLKVVSDTDPGDRTVIRFLEQRIDRECDTIAQRIAKQYQEKEIYRSYYDKVFRNDTGTVTLPTGKVLRQLFEYYAFQQILGEQGVEKRDGFTPVTQSRFYLKTLSLLKTTQDLGEFFSLMEDKPGMARDQVMRKTIQDLVKTQETEVARRVEVMKLLAVQEAKLARGITQLQLKLAPMGLSKASELATFNPEFNAAEKLLEVLHQRQQRILSMLAREDGVFQLDEALQAEVREAADSEDAEDLRLTAEDTGVMRLLSLAHKTGTVNPK